MATANSSKLSREDFKRQKALEEQRKAGTVPAEIDPETGQDINPHIPDFMKQAPWYLGVDHPTLKHQRPSGNSAKATKQDPLNHWYQRGLKAGPAATKFRKGACENCGAMTHKSKDCIERPRKLGAKWTNTDIQQDEIVQQVDLGFEAKRDRWNGYDPAMHQAVIEEWELIDQQRRKLKEQQSRERLLEKARLAEERRRLKREKAEAEGIELADEDLDSSSEDEKSEESGDEDKYADTADAAGQHVDTKNRTTVRNLRIREDTAKYLLNLDVNSAHYDPKTRSMRENPLKDKEGVAGSAAIAYQGDNFERYTGEAPHVARMQMFAWEAAERGKEVHLNTNPTQAELLHRDYTKRKETVQATQKNSILERYGGAEHLDAPPKELLLAQSENYVEYSQAGRVISGQERATAKSKYQEDVFPLNHKSVWGSYWKSGEWGYSCCHSTLRNSYCTGQAGIDAAASMKMIQASSGAGGQKAKQAVAAATTTTGEGTKPRSLMEDYVMRAVKGEFSSQQDKPEGKRKAKGERLGEGQVEIDAKKLKLAIQAEEERLKGDSSAALSVGKNGEVTEEDLEAYRMKRVDVSDPMHALLHRKGNKDDQGGDGGDDGDDMELLPMPENRRK